MGEFVLVVVVLSGHLERFSVSHMQDEQIHSYEHIHLKFCISIKAIMAMTSCHLEDTQWPPKRKPD